MSVPYRLHYAPDNASLVIRLALEEMGVPYDTVLVDRQQRSHKHPDYLKLNPAGLVPALETPAGPIFETAAILLWLADQHSAMAPASGDTERGAFLKYLFFTSNTLHVAARIRFYPEQYLGDETSAYGTLRTHMISELQRHLSILEAAAADRPTWLCGEKPSVLDVYIACICRWLMLYPRGEDKAWCQLVNWPNLHDMATRLEHCDCTQAAIEAEGLGPNPFTSPKHPTPPEGSAT